MTDNLPKRDARGYWLPGTGSPNPGGRPKKDIDIEALATSHSIEAFGKLIELLSHRDGRVQLAAANSILDRAFGRPHQRVQAEVQHLDIGKLWLQAVQSFQDPPAKTIEADATSQIIAGYPTPQPVTATTLPVLTGGNDDGGTTRAANTAPTSGN